MNYFGAAWAESTAAKTPSQLPPDECSLAELVAFHAATRPEALAITSGSDSVSFAELYARSVRVAAALAGEGLSASDRVAYLDKNAPEFFEVLFGCAVLGAVMTPLNWRLSLPELAAIVEDARARILIVGAELAPVAQALAAGGWHVEKVVVVGHDATGLGYHQWRDASPGCMCPARRSEPSDVALQLYTSGTTGTAKGVMLSERNLLSLASAGWSALALSPASVNLVPMPLFHIGGIGYAMIGFFAGSHTVVVRQADPSEMLQVMSQRRVTNTFVVPAVLAMMLASMETRPESEDLSALAVVCYGASPISETVLSRAVERFGGCQFVQVYGLTETTGTVTLLSDADHRSALVGFHAERLRSAGRAVAGAEVRIVDAHLSSALAPGQVGEIWIRSPQNTVGYWNMPSETAAVLDADGWLRTGDAGYLDDDGYLFIHDRVKDMIISGGENVFPAELENVLMAHPDVSDVAVIGVPSDKWGETVKAVVVPASALHASGEEMIAFARGRLAHYKCPTSIDFVDTLPRNASGKVLKRELRSCFWEGRSRPLG